MYVTLIPCTLIIHRRHFLSQLQVWSIKHIGKESSFVEQILRLFWCSMQFYAAFLPNQSRHSQSLCTVLSTIPQDRVVMALLRSIYVVICPIPFQDRLRIRKPSTWKLKIGKILNQVFMSFVAYSGCVGWMHLRYGGFGCRGFVVCHDMPSSCAQISPLHLPFDGQKGNNIYGRLCPKL